MAYRLAPRGVIRLADNKLITRDMSEWADYRAFIKAGNFPQPLPVPTGPTVPSVLVEIKTKITAKRDAVQHGGATIGGVAVNTDTSSLAALNQILQFSGMRPQRVFKIKTANLQHVPMTRAQINNLFDTLGERMALCLDNEAAHYAAVSTIASKNTPAAARIAALRAYDFSTGWPD